MSVAAPTLTGTHVQLEQLSLDFAEELTAAGNQDRSTYGWTPVPPTVEGMQRYIIGLLNEQHARTAIPFVQRRTSDGELVGCTRYLRLEWWAGGDLPAEVEIGGTWLAASAQRTPINTEAKYLLLSNAFDSWNVHRVSICTDARNTQSRTAILRIGASFEGILSSHRGSYAPGEENVVARDSAMYSIIRSEWPAVKHDLEGRLQ
ncbi:MAG: GNAT family N-acetyltransferase [Ilumatobacteraceae bacterium]|nr:GNAT family N-acetyltransferase [Ilumatobacteraceae bacterium]